MIKNNPTDYLSQQEDKLFGIYKGVIEDNDDTEKMGRCRIRVFGVHTPKKIKSNTEGIPTGEIPWAEPALGLFEGSLSGFGAWTVPLQGSLVFIFFEQGNILKPRYFATIPGKPTDKNHAFDEDEGFSDPDGVYPVQTTVAPHKPNALNESDYHRLAKGTSTDTIVESKNTNKDTNITSGLSEPTWNEPDSSYNAEYPHNKVFTTHSGITIEVDDTPDNERLHIYHPSNTYIEINKDGKMIIRNAQDKFEIVDRDKYEHIQQHYNINVNTDKISKIGGVDLQEVGGDSILYVKGKLYISADDGIDMWSNNDINIDGNNIHLNDGIAVKKNTR